MPAPFGEQKGKMRNMFILFSRVEAVTRRVPLGSKQRADIGLECALNCEITALETKSLLTTFSRKVGKKIQFSSSPQLLCHSYSVKIACSTIINLGAINSWLMLSMEHLDDKLLSFKTERERERSCFALVVL